VKSSLLCMLLWVLGCGVTLSVRAECVQDYHLISDFDDTIKTYRWENFYNVAREAFFTHTINAGIDTLYNEMLKQSTDPDCYLELNSNNDLFTVLSKSPKLVRGPIKSFFRKNKLPRPYLFVRGFFNFLNFGENYKLKKLRKRAQQKKVPFILIGDDTSIDNKVYHQFSNRYPQRVLDIYIHNITNARGYTGQIKYITAFEVALNEYLNQRLTAEAVLKVGQTILRAKHRAIIPPYGFCPLEPLQHQITNSDIIDAMANKITELVHGICHKRNHLKRD